MYLSDFDKFIKVFQYRIAFSKKKFASSLTPYATPSGWIIDLNITCKTKSS